MRVILYMASTVNGFIAKEDDDTSWITKEEWDSYSAAVRKARALIVGRRTYEILTKQPEFEELKDVKLVTVSHNQFPTLSPNHLVAATPKEALALLTDYNEVIVAGGGILNSAFMEENLIDEIYLDVEPIILGKGIPLFAQSDFEKKLELLETKKISDNELQLHFKVLKD
jgi:dihydrofolate reductase